MSELTQAALTTQQRAKLDRMNRVTDEVNLGSRIFDMEAMLRSLDARASVRLKTAKNIATLIGGASVLVDGKVARVGDRILVGSQSTGAQNGLYEVESSGSLWILFDNQTAAYNVGATLTGGTSGATGTIAEVDDNGTTGAIRLTNVIGEFQNNETIADDGATPGSATSNGTLGDWLVNFDGQSTNIVTAEVLTFSGGGVGTVVGLQDDGATGQVVVTRTSGAAPANNETITGSIAGDGDVNGDASDGATGTWVRADDAITAGAMVFVAEGATQANTIWQVTTNDPITVGTTTITFAQAAISSADLASTATGKGASLVGLEDVAGNVAATNVEAAIAEIYNDAMLRSSNTQTIVAAAGDRVTNTVSQTAFATTYDISGAAVGDVYRVTFAVLLPSTNSTDTIALALKVGAISDVGELAAYDAANDDAITCTADILVTAIGASGTVTVHGQFTKSTGGTTTVEAFNVVEESVDFTASPTVSLLATWSVADTGNQADLRVLRVERIRPA